MKKRIILSVTFLAVLVLAICAFTNRAEADLQNAELASLESPAPEKNEVEITIGPDLPDFMFDFGTRYKSIKKSDLNQATSFEDFIGRKHAERIVNYKTLCVYEMKDGMKTDKKLTSNTGELTPAQRDYLHAAEYSSDVLIWATYTEKWPETGLVEESYWTPHLTVVPEQQAHYELGKEVLLDYLRVGSASLTSNNLDDKIQPGRISLTISKEGKLSHIKLNASSGNKEIDEKIIELISTAPGQWIPAENAEGIKVDQDLVVFYGSIGC